MNFELTVEQKKLFIKLKAAYKACEKAGILLVNDYGALEAYDKSIVAGYDDVQKYDESDDDVVTSHESYTAHSFAIASQWADDKHLIKLTRKGLKLKNAGQ